jgi:hypothetical protein
MTHFLDLRLQPIGGELASAVSTMQSTASGYQSLSRSDLLSAIQGQHVLIATHGFNVNRAAGIECLANWEGLLKLSQPTLPFTAFVGLLWPGDSDWAHGLDYPGEPKVADRAGPLLASFLDANFQGALSISFASHSLGARVVLATISHLNLPVRRATLMAPAIDDNCLTKEFQNTVAKIDTISVLASKKDTVLSEAFPLGNFFAGIIDQGHPWWRAALGHCGPTKPWPANFQAPYELPDIWEFKHSNYLQVDPQPPSTVSISPPVDVPSQGTPPPMGYGWQEAWSAAFASTRFQ